MTNFAVYKLWSSVGPEYYIGSTIKTLERRLSEHFSG